MNEPPSLSAEQGVRWNGGPVDPRQTTKSTLLSRRPKPPRRGSGCSMTPGRFDSSNGWQEVWVWSPGLSLSLCREIDVSDNSPDVRKDKGLASAYLTRLGYVVPGACRSEPKDNEVQQGGSLNRFTRSRNPHQPASTNPLYLMVGSNLRWHWDPLTSNRSARLVFPHYEKAAAVSRGG